MQTAPRSTEHGVFLDAFLAGLKPDPKLTVSEWADEHRMLSPKAAAEPGPWRTDRVPYAREIMDELSPSSPAEEVVLMKGTQIAGTEMGNNWLGYIICHAPGPAMLVLPTSNTGKRSSKGRIAPLIDETPIIRRHVRDKRSRDSGNTLAIKEFDGGVLVIAGANSAAELRSMPARYLFLDEVDAYPADVGGEGDPVAIAIKRTNTYKRTRKIYHCSTPLTRGLSRIESKFEQGDQRRYHVPCPDCGTYQPITWAQIQWRDDDPGTAAMACVGCGVLIEEHHKTWMLAHGRWIAEKPGHGDGKIVSFHLSTLYSPLGWYSWADAATEFLEAKRKNDPALLQAWVNTVLGETWEEGGERPDADGLLARREHYAAEVPRGGLVLVAGVDCQDDRLEVEVFAYGKGEESWTVDLRIIRGDPSQARVWKDLDDALGAQYAHEFGARLPIAATCIDSGGHHTQEVYDYVKTRQHTRRIWAIKGMAGSDRPIVTAPSRKRHGRERRKVDLYGVGVDQVKGLIYHRLKVHEAGPGYIHLPLAVASGDVVDEEYLEQLCAEKCVTRYEKGWPKKVWIKTRPRNEALDRRVYGYAALKLLNPVWEALAERLRPAEAPELPLEGEVPREAEPELDAAPDDAPVPEVEPAPPTPTRRRRPSRPRGGFVNGWKN